MPPAILDIPMEFQGATASEIFAVLENARLLRQALASTASAGATKADTYSVEMVFVNASRDLHVHGANVTYYGPLAAVNNVPPPPRFGPYGDVYTDDDSTGRRLEPEGEDDGYGDSTDGYYGDLADSGDSVAAASSGAEPWYRRAAAAALGGAGGSAVGRRLSMEPPRSKAEAAARSIRNQYVSSHYAGVYGSLRRVAELAWAAGVGPRVVDPLERSDNFARSRVLGRAHLLNASALGSSEDSAAAARMLSTTSATRMILRILVPSKNVNDSTGTGVNVVKQQELDVAATISTLNASYNAPAFLPDSTGALTIANPASAETIFGTFLTALAAQGFTLTVTIDISGILATLPLVRFNVPAPPAPLYSPAESASISFGAVCAALVAATTVTFLLRMRYARGGKLPSDKEKWHGAFEEEGAAKGAKELEGEEEQVLPQGYLDNEQRKLNEWNDRELPIRTKRTPAVVSAMRALRAQKADLLRHHVEREVHFMLRDPSVRRRLERTRARAAKHEDEEIAVLRLATEAMQAQALAAATGVREDAERALAAAKAATAAREGVLRRVREREAAAAAATAAEDGDDGERWAEGLDEDELAVRAMHEGEENYGERDLEEDDEDNAGLRQQQEEEERDFGDVAGDMTRLPTLGPRHVSPPKAAGAFRIDRMLGPSARGAGDVSARASMRDRSDREAALGSRYVVSDDSDEAADEAAAAALGHGPNDGEYGDDGERARDLSTVPVVHMGRKAAGGRDRRLRAASRASGRAGRGGTAAVTERPPLVVEELILPPIHVRGGVPELSPAGDRVVLVRSAALAESAALMASELADREEVAGFGVPLSFHISKRERKTIERQMRQLPAARRIAAAAAEISSFRATTDTDTLLANLQLQYLHELASRPHDRDGVGGDGDDEGDGGFDDRAADFDGGAGEDTNFFDVRGGAAGADMLAARPRSRAGAIGSAGSPVPLSAELGDAGAGTGLRPSTSDGIMALVEAAAAASHDRDDDDEGFGGGARGAGSPRGARGPAADVAQLDGLLSEYLSLVTSDPDREVQMLGASETEGSDVIQAAAGAGAGAGGPALDAGALLAGAAAQPRAAPQTQSRSRHSLLPPLAHGSVSEDSEDGAEAGDEDDGGAAAAARAALAEAKQNTATAEAAAAAAGLATALPGSARPARSRSSSPGRGLSPRAGSPTVATAEAERRRRVEEEEEARRAAATQLGDRSARLDHPLAPPSADELLSRVRNMYSAQRASLEAAGAAARARPTLAGMPAAPALAAAAAVVGPGLSSPGAAPGGFGVKVPSSYSVVRRIHPSLISSPFLDTSATSSAAAGGSGSAGGLGLGLGLGAGGGAFVRRGAFEAVGSRPGTVGSSGFGFSRPGTSLNLGGVLGASGSVGPGGPDSVSLMSIGPGAAASGSFGFTPQSPSSAWGGTTPGGPGAGALTSPGQRPVIQAGASIGSLPGPVILRGGPGGAPGSRISLGGGPSVVTVAPAGPAGPAATGSLRLAPLASPAAARAAGAQPGQGTVAAESRAPTAPASGPR